MSGVDLDETTESDSQQSTSETAQLAWDPSVGPTPIGFGWDAEPLVIDWDGTGRHDLLVSAGGGPLGRQARLFRALAATDDLPARFDEGEPVPALDGLRGLCAVPNGRGDRFD